MKQKRYTLIPGIGIEDTHTGEIYITLIEIIHLLNTYEEKQR